MPAYKDDDRNTWYAKFNYRDWTGAIRQKKKRGFKLKREAQDYEKEFLNKQSRSSDMSFFSLVQLYKEDMGGRLKGTTKKNKRWLMDTHIMPYFSELRINKITPADIRVWQSALIAKKYSPTYLKSINNQLVAVLNYAVKFYGLPSNPCHVAGSMGKKDADTMKFWTHEDFSKFITTVKKWPARVGFELLYWSGMRIGELLALCESDFDFQRGTLTIVKNFQPDEDEEGGEEYIEEDITTVKTKKSNRTIPMPAAVLDLVKKYIPRLYDYQSGDRLFPYTKAYFSYEKAKGVEASGVEYIRLHDFRHSHAALLIEMGVPILLISERLGHEDVETTLRTYGHLYPNKHDDTIARLNDLIDKKNSDTEAAATPAPAVVDKYVQDIITLGAE